MKSWSRIQRINKQIPSSWYGDYPPGVVPGALPGFLVKSPILAPTMDASRMTGSKEESTSADKKTELLSKKPPTPSVPALAPPSEQAAWSTSKGSY